MLFHVHPPRRLTRSHQSCRKDPSLHSTLDFLLLFGSFLDPIRTRCTSLRGHVYVSSPSREPLRSRRWTSHHHFPSSHTSSTLCGLVGRGESVQTESLFTLRYIPKLRLSVWDFLQKVVTETYDHLSSDLSHSTLFADHLVIAFSGPSLVRPLWVFSTVYLPHTRPVCLCRRLVSTLGKTLLFYVFLVLNFSFRLIREIFPWAEFIDKTFHFLLQIPRNWYLKLFSIFWNYLPSTLIFLSISSKRGWKVGYFLGETFRDCLLVRRNHTFEVPCPSSNRSVPSGKIKLREISKKFSKRNISPT